LSVHNWPPVREMQSGYSHLVILPSRSTSTNG
jgi:hypothetical protein